MWTWVSPLCVLWVTPILCAFHGDCPRKEPPPGVVVVSPGSQLVLTCGGHVIVDGVKVMPHSHRFSAAVTPSSANISHNAVLSDRHISTNRREGTGRMNPTTPSSGLSRTLRTESKQDGGRLDEFEEEGKGEQALKQNFRWKHNNKDVKGGTEGSALSVSHMSTSDSGRYSCHYGDMERFSTKVIVTEAAETPRLSCYKRSPSSKIRCEWTPLTPVHKSTSCSLLIRKRLAGGFHRVPCSYSTRRSRCWCALDHDDDDRRTLHQALLCVSSLVSNATSQLFSFNPMQILKPDPPHNVSVQTEAGRSQLAISWSPPRSWKFQDRFYELIYEVRYKPVASAHFQTVTLRERPTRHTVTDAQAGQEYEVQVRSKDEYDGQWSDWSAPQYGCSWTDTSNEDLSATPFPYVYYEGSGSGDQTEDYPGPAASPRGPFSHHHLWIKSFSTVLAGLTFTVLLLYMLRYKDKCMSKVHRLSVLAQCSDSVHPQPAPPLDIAPVVAERHALLHKPRPPDEVNERSEQELKSGDRTEATDLNNTSYFFIPREV